MPKRLVAGMLFAAAVFAASRAQAEMPTIGLSAGLYVIRVEVAYTFETRTRGLMYRESLEPNQGMLFVFTAVERHCMWMKNTPLPLSVAFIDPAGKVVSISEMAPHTETAHCAAQPARFALEMNRGWFAAKGIRAGSTIQGLDKAPPPQ